MRSSEVDMLRDSARPSAGLRPSWSIWDLCPSGRGRFACRCYAGIMCPFSTGFGDEAAFENGDAA